MEPLHVKTDIETRQGFPTWVRMLRTNGGAIYADILDISFVWSLAGKSMTDDEEMQLRDDEGTIIDTLRCKSYRNEGTVCIHYYYAELRKVMELYKADAGRLSWLRRLQASFMAEEARLTRMRYAAMRYLTAYDFLIAYPFVAGTKPLTPDAMYAIAQKEHIASSIENNRGNHRLMREALARYGYAPKYKNEYYD